ncbi:MAG TPA: tetratricopeptide repeat protein, partial [Blastocatellia bacterium]|nr:tetratricopeptide repeat protein [Blastocatellia bacterium]
GNVLYRARRYDEAIAVLRKTLDMEPNFHAAYAYLGICYLMQGKREEALAEFRKGLAAAPGHPDFISLLGYAYGLAGKHDEARRYLEELNALAKRAYVPPSSYTGIYAGLGEMDAYFEWMEKCFQERSPTIRGLKYEPLYDMVRGDPRFQELLRRAGFEP